MQRPGKGSKLEKDAVGIIENDAQKLLVIQQEGAFTYRCVDCLHNPTTCLRTAVMPCIVHGQNAEDLGLGSKTIHALWCLLAPLVIGSQLSVGRSKEVYRNRNGVPGLHTDDGCMGCCCPMCLICQIRNELDTKQQEEAEIKRMTTETLAQGQNIARQ